MGSGLAATYGFPLSIEGASPSIFNVNTQSMLLNLGQMDFIRSAKNELNAANFSAADRRQQVILDAASAYSQLDTVSSAINVTKQQLESAERAEKLVVTRARRRGRGGGANQSQADDGPSADERCESTRSSRRLANALGRAHRATCRADHHQHGNDSLIAGGKATR